MSSVTLVLIVGLTSLGAYLAATRFTGLRRADLQGAVMETLECLGLVVIFFLANFAVGTALILALRALTGRFISVYIVNDVTLAILSLLQALVFHRWRARSIG
jgi:uncharacterized membrane protein